MLLAIQSGTRTVDEEFEHLVTVYQVDARDRALAMELIYGVLRRLEFLDWRLAALLNKPLSRLPVAVQMTIRMGAYQLLFLDRIPASAAVNESVRLAKWYAPQWGHDWSGLVNAVLRNLLRRPEPPRPAINQDPAGALSVLYSVPLWLCRRWIDRLGPEKAEQVCEAAGSLPPLTLRVNRLRLTRDQFLDRCHHHGIEAMPTVFSPVGVLLLPGGGSVTAIPGFADGDFYVEDEAAQLIPLLLAPQPGELVLDACAAPGGKTTHMAELMGNRGHIVAVDRKRARLKLLQNNCRRLGITNVIPLLADARKSREAIRLFRCPVEGKSYAIPGEGPSSATSDARFAPDGLVDRILLDAPCSGLGVLRRHPEIKCRMNPARLARHRWLQGEILESVASVLRPGGVLVYSTCSTEQEETEEVIERFCRHHAGWIRESVEPWLPPSALSFVTAQGAFSTMGNGVGMDGFYAVRLKRVR
ncbi:MAG: 16S rRNA (cytosine(967)-C(5))-methyltransferase RsmB [Nitrospira sp.]|nr:16S rRNA (cytosine(967)-C(5))-methyltransferase RsmB [Nitrospira sp.]